MSPKRFFKNTKKDKAGNRRANEFPSNSRSIPEASRFKFPKLDHANLLGLYGKALKISVAVVFVVAVVIVGYDLQKNIISKQNIDSQREQLTRELKFWEDFLEKHQNFKDAYFQAAILEYRLGQITQAKAKVKKGLSLDPNSEEGRKIEEILNK